MYRISGFIWYIQKVYVPFALYQRLYEDRLILLYHTRSPAQDVGLHGKNG